MPIAQKWPDCCPQLKNYVNGFVKLFDTQLGRQLLGVYLHGSLAMGCWYFPKSDLDLLIVTGGDVPSDTLESLGIQIARYSEKYPGTGGVELSVVTEDALSSLDLQIPYQLHYSPMWHEKLLAGQVDFCKPKRDPDLPAHFAVVRQRGVCLYGREISKLFPPVDWQRFRQSVLLDIQDLLEEENLLHAPYYGVLNFCRALQLFSSPVCACTSKEEGALWALEHLPEPFLPLVRQALDVYRSEAPVTSATLKTGGVRWDKEQLMGLRDYVLSQLPSLAR